MLPASAILCSVQFKTDTNIMNVKCLCHVSHLATAFVYTSRLVMFAPAMRTHTVRWLLAEAAASTTQPCRADRPPVLSI